MSAYDFRIGTTRAGMVNIETLVSGLYPMPAPHAIWQPYAEYIRLEDNTYAGIGAPIAVWKFGWLTRAQRDALRVFCPGPSAAIWIRTQSNDNSDVYLDCNGIMVWPLTEERDSTRRINLEIVTQQITTYAIP